MRELNVNEIKEVSGGVAPLIAVAVWAAKTTAVRVVAKGVIGGVSAFSGYKAVKTFTQ